MWVFTILVAYLGAGGLGVREGAGCCTPGSGAGAAAARDARRDRDDLVDEAVVLGLLGGVPAVTVAVADDRLHGLAGVVGGDLRHPRLRAEQVLRLDLDVRGGTADAGRTLVHEDVGVGEREALARRATGEQELAHRGRHAHTDGDHVVRDVLHGVVDRHAGRHRAAGAVDVEVDVLVGFRGKEQKLCGDLVGDVIVDLLTEEDDALAEQSAVDLVTEASTEGRLSGGVGHQIRHVSTCSSLTAPAVSASSYRAGEGIPHPSSSWTLTRRWDNAIPVPQLFAGSASSAVGTGVPAPHSDATGYGGGPRTRGA